MLIELLAQDKKTQDIPIVYVDTGITRYDFSATDCSYTGLQFGVNQSL